MLPLAVALLLESAALDSVSTSAPIVADSISLASVDQARLSSLLRERFVRVASQGTIAEVGAAWVVDEGLAFEGSRAKDLPNPITWSQVDTVWTRGNMAWGLGLLGAVLGGIAAHVMSQPEDTDIFTPFTTPLSMFTVTVTGAVVGGAVGGVVGSRIHTGEPCIPPNRKGHGEDGRSSSWLPSSPALARVIAA